jgi:hypothetical protein
VPSAGEAEALIEEARRLQRRRRRRVGLVITLIAVIAGAAAAWAGFGTGGGDGGGGGGAPRPATSRAASPGQIRAFLAQAERAVNGAFSLAYVVTVRYQGGSVRHLAVTAAQTSPATWFYRETPSLSVSGPGGPPQDGSYEVFFAARGLFSCARGSLSSRWACTGPYRGIGMGTTSGLLGPYPPQALLRGLQNTAEIYTGVPAPPAAHPQRAFLFTQRRAGQTLSCLGFGQASHPLGTVCLEPDGVIASYDLPGARSSIAYQTATLRTYSPQAENGTFTLPAAAHPSG